MAGLIIISDRDDISWSAPSWLFDWVVGRLARDLPDEDAARRLDEIVDQNLGIVVVDDFEEDLRQRLLGSIRNQLVPWAESELFLRPGLNREGALNQIRDLAGMVRQ
jgi:hypothetical protein